MGKQGCNILVIEPDPVLAKMMIDWIGDVAHVTHSQDTNSAIEQVAFNHWDLVITDINAPEINDLDITRMVKGSNPATAVLIITENIKVDFILTAMQNHADSLLFKPLNKDEFMSRVLQLSNNSLLIKQKKKKTVLAIGAHPDDVEFGCAGTLAKYRDEGSSLTILTLSLGEVGGNAILRKNESEIAASIQGADLIFGDFIDTEIQNTIKTIQFIEHVIEQIKPTHVYTHSFFDSHQDHRNVYQASVTACRKIPNLYSYLSPSSTVDYRPNVFINIDHYMEIKLQAIAAFSSQSQIRPYMQPEMIKAIALYWGRFGNYHLIEPMTVIKEQEV